MGQNRMTENSCLALEGYIRVEWSICFYQLQLNRVDFYSLYIPGLFVMRFVALRYITSLEHYDVLLWWRAYCKGYCCLTNLAPGNSNGASCNILGYFHFGRTPVRNHFTFWPTPAQTMKRKIEDRTDCIFLHVTFCFQQLRTCRSTAEWCLVAQKGQLVGIF